MLVDSHCHLNCIDLSNDNNALENVLERAKENDVQNILCVCIDLSNFQNVLSIASKYDYIHASVGIHPNSEQDEVSRADELIDLSNNENVIAIGETGLDYFRTTDNLDEQRDLFAKHIEVSATTNKPLIVHSRDAEKDTIGMLKELSASEVGGIMHCFVYNTEIAKKVLDLNFYISLSGIVTFKNAKEIQEVAKYIPLDRMLIETDSPYLSPVPHRGKVNEPSFVKFVAEKIAELRGVSFEEIATATTNNYFQLFEKFINK